MVFGGHLALTDTHCHLDFEAFDSDRAHVLERARQEGLTRILNPGIDLRSSRKAIQLSEDNPELYVAVGVHPNSATIMTKQIYEELSDLAAHPKVVAIGEIGLDYYRDRAPQDVQLKIFQMQLELAAEHGLPVVIHNRQATDDVLRILSEWHAQLSRASSPLADRPGVLHSYSDNDENGMKAIDMNFFIGITGPVTFQNAKVLQGVVSVLPVSHLLIETDAPFLTPHPKRGQRNEPALVRRVAEKIAELHSKSTAEVAVVTTENADRLFNWRVTA